MSGPSEAEKQDEQNSISSESEPERPSGSLTDTVSAPLSNSPGIRDTHLVLKRRKLLADRTRLGRWGERRCERFLKKKGLKTLARNFACKTGELDLIMVDTDGSVVFVEVKTRANETFDAAESVITTAKKDKAARTARYFLTTHNIDDRPFRFDVVTIILGQTGRPQIRHYQNAFAP
jgi:putative endonuclease